MPAPSQQSGRAGMIMAIVGIVGGVIAWEYFELEEKLIGYGYVDFWWGKFTETVQGIPDLIDSMLRSVRNL